MDNYIIIGFMGCGKSTISIKLSYRLQMVMLDTDKLIEQKAGKTIAEIFADEGEDAFRRMETELLQELLQTTRKTIVSVGGGTPLREENRELLRKLGIVIYLDVSAQTVYERLKDDTTRPLLQGQDAKEKIEELLAKRRSIYEDVAQITIHTDGKDFDEIMDEIQSKI